MMERQRRDQGRLFYEFRLENRIPENCCARMNVFVGALPCFNGLITIETSTDLATGADRGRAEPVQSPAKAGEGTGPKKAFVAAARSESADRRTTQRSPFVNIHDAM